MKKVAIIAIVVVLVVSTSAYLLTRKSPEVKPEPTSTPEVLGESVIEPSPTPTIKPIPTTTPETSVKGYGEMNESGTNTSFVMDIPVKGGKVTGTVSGYCEGNLEGVFDPRTDFIQGTLKGSCFKVPATGSFEGKVSLKTKMGSGTYKGKSLFLEKSGSWSLAIKP